MINTPKMRVKTSLSLGCVMAFACLCFASAYCDEAVVQLNGVSGGNSVRVI